MKCLSTHGSAGYAPGSYVREDGKIVCGICGLVFEHQGWLPEWVKDQSPTPTDPPPDAVRQESDDDDGE